MIFIGAAVVNDVYWPDPIVKIDHRITLVCSAVDRRTAGLEMEIVRQGRSVDKVGVRVREIAALRTTDSAAAKSRTVVENTADTRQIGLHETATDRTTTI